MAKSTMPHLLKLIAVGASTGAIIPEDLLQRLGVNQGDTLFAVETPQGLLLRPEDPALEEDLELGREMMREHRGTFQTLAS